MIYLAYIIAWVCTTVAVAIGLLYTGEWIVLFFLILPSCISLKFKDNEGNGKEL